ncbi:DUF6894 family protein [Methylobacterium sp. A54F]
MPRFFFNVYDGRSEIDHDGTELSDHHEARRQAIRFAGRILDDEAHRIAIGEEWRMEVTDERGLVLFRLDFMVTGSPVITHSPGASAS